MAEAPSSRPAVALVLAAIGLLQAGCAATPVAMPDPAALQALPPQPVALSAGSAAWPAADWWRTLGDPALDRLIARALADSATLDAADARLARAEALAREAGETLSGGAHASVAHQRASEFGMIPPAFAGRWSDSTSIGLDLGWSPDLSGRLRAALASARGLVAASAADRDGARLMLSSALARGWAGLARADALLASADAMVTIQADVAALTRLRRSAGLDSEQAVARADAQWADARREQAARAASARIIRLQLAALAGLTPDEGLALPTPRLARAPEAGLPAALPADLLSRRPDLAAARARVEAATADVDGARAAFRPNVNLSAAFSLQSLGFEHALDPGALGASFGPALTLPLFDRARLSARLDARAADRWLAVASWDQAVVDALQDVGQSLAALQAADRQAEEAEAGLDRQAAAQSLVRARRSAGVASRLEELSADAAVLMARRAVDDAAAARIETRVDLARALGGGWQPAPVPDGT